MSTVYAISDRSFDDLDTPVRRVTDVPSPTPYAPVLDEQVVPDVAAIEAALRGLLAE